MTKEISLQVRVRTCKPETPSGASISPSTTAQEYMRLTGVSATAAYLALCAIRASKPEETT